MRTLLHFRLWMALLALAGIVTMILLGNWQSGRAREKAQMQAQLESAQSGAPVLIDAFPKTPEDLLYRSVVVTGVFQASQAILLDNRLRAGVPGYEVVAPLMLPTGQAILVNRGWVKASPDRSALPDIATPREAVTISGIALPITARFVELSSDTIAGKVWQNLDFERYRAHTRLEFAPLVIQQRSALNDGLDRRWPRPDARIDTHRAYALQWYTMAVAILILYIVFHVRVSRTRS